MKFHIFLPDELYTRMEEKRRWPVNRSQFIQQALSAYLENDSVEKKGSGARIGHHAPTTTDHSEASPE